MLTIQNDDAQIKDIYSRHANVLVFHFRGESFDFAKEMNSWGLESITALALDTRLNSNF